MTKTEVITSGLAIIITGCIFINPLAIGLGVAILTISMFIKNKVV